MKLINTIELVIKKSRFVAYYYEINDIDDVIIVLETLRKEHKKARHLPYAYKIGNVLKKSDDKEPNGTAGSPILNIIEKKKLTNCLIIVIRYFGGIKLGAGGLTRAYSNASNEVTKTQN